ncbi:MAG: bifunctional diaminohydroxyphosphoribosylaminopyrimidine deaminase/5-amino-6-(5-phosphoribosylamino)uracil reductase RibD [Candidatus Tyrphobacter sp.]
MISALDRLFLERTYELAARGADNTAPNPPVGAVVVVGDRVLGEGFHHAAGRAHAEVEALAAAGNARGATLYVSLEPCRHFGRTPPCTQALLDAGIVRVVAGTADPTQHGGGAVELRQRHVDVEIAGDARARELIEVFARSDRDCPYVSLKMAMSLDGYVASKPGAVQWVTGEDERVFVRELRIAHDAVMVGAGTVRIDDPLLTVRPVATRVRPFVRVVACERTQPLETSRVFTPVDGYDRTIVLAPAGAEMTALKNTADVLSIDGEGTHLDLRAALRALRARGISSVLCEGGPMLAAALIAQGLVDRLYWFVAPVMLGSVSAVPVLAGETLNGGPRPLRLERLERIGRDALLRASFTGV